MAIVINNKIAIKGSMATTAKPPTITTYKVDFKSTTTSVPDSPGYNVVDNINAGSVFNLVSDAAADEGYQLELIDTWVTTIENAASMSEDQYGFAFETGHTSFLVGVAVPQASFKIKNLANGSTYSISFIGQNVGVPSRDAEFTILSETKIYDNSADAASIGVPVTFTGTVTNNEIIVTQSATTDYSYMNACILDLSS